MKVKIVESPKKINRFPRLMKSINNHHIVLFTRAREGVCIGNAKPSTRSRGVDIGYGSDSWNMNLFENYSGTLTLEND